MKYLIILIFLLLSILNCFSQTEDEKTSYGKLETKSWDKMGSCRPCILEYRKSGVVLIRSVQYQDCPIGFYKEFFPNGKLKIRGQYKENTTGNWQNNFGRGHCVKVGEWIHYDENGKELTREYWKDNVFIKQIPDLSTNELWKTEITLNGAILDYNQEIQISDIPDLNVRPYFKNKSKGIASLIDSIEISAINKPILRIHKSTPDVKMILKEMGISPNDKVSLAVVIYENKEAIRHFYLRLKQ